MTKTLADMTTEERAECVGMWASHQGHEDKNDPDDECGGVTETLIAQPENGQSAQIQRLQSAVTQLLCELHIYQEQETEQRIRKEPLDTLETYGLTKEDME